MCPYFAFFMDLVIIMFEAIIAHTSMKIYFVTSKLNFRTAGGSIDEFDLMMRTLIDMGHEVTAVTTFSTTNIIPHKLPYKLIEEQIESRGMLGIQKGVYGILKKHENDADLFHVDGHNFLYGAGAYRACGGRVPVTAFFNREMIVWGQQTPETTWNENESLPRKIKRSLRFAFERHLLMPLTRHIDVHFFTNPSLRKFYERSGLVTNKRSFIFGDPYDFRETMQKYNITEDSYRERNKSRGPYTIFYSARHVDGKGFDLLIRAFALVKDKAQFRLVLGGDGPLLELHKKLAEELGVASFIEFPGWVERERVMQYFKEADIFIQPRWRHELTSMTVLFAMAFGLPQILPGGGGLEWDAKGGAVYFKDNDPVLLAQKIEQLGADHEFRAALSAGGYARLKEPEMDYRLQIKHWIDSAKECIAK